MLIIGDLLNTFFCVKSSTEAEIKTFHQKCFGVLVLNLIGIVIVGFRLISPM